MGVVQRVQTPGQNKITSDGSSERGNGLAFEPNARVLRRLGFHSRGERHCRRCAHAGTGQRIIAVAHLPCVSDLNRIGPPTTATSSFVHHEASSLPIALARARGHVRALCDSVVPDTAWPGHVCTRPKTSCCGCVWDKLVDRPSLPWPRRSVRALCEPRPGVGQRSLGGWV